MVDPGSVALGAAGLAAFGAFVKYLLDWDAQKTTRRHGAYKDVSDNLRAACIRINDAISACTAATLRHVDQGDIDARRAHFNDMVSTVAALDAALRLLGEEADARLPGERFEAQPDMAPVRTAIDAMRTPCRAFLQSAAGSGGPPGLDMAAILRGMDELDRALRAYSDRLLHNYVDILLVTPQQQGRMRRLIGRRSPRSLTAARGGRPPQIAGSREQPQPTGLPTVEGTGGGQP